MASPAPENGPHPVGVSPALGPISLGCVTFGREIDEEASFAIMEHAYSRGIAWFDTATTYGDGRSEQIIGAWLRTRGFGTGAPAIATKLYPPYSAQSIRDGAAACAHRLGVVSIDLLYLHAWDKTAQDPEVLVALDGLVRSERTRALGASNFTIAQLAAILD